MKLFLLIILFYSPSFIFAQLNGNYSIGNVSSDFSTINDAIDSLELVGMSDDVVFQIDSGFYYENILLNNIVIPPSFLVTFVGAVNDSSYVVIRGDSLNSTNATLHINNTNNLIFQNLTLKIGENSSGSLLNITCNNIRFQNVKLDGFGSDTTIFVIDSLNSELFSNCHLNSDRSTVLKFQIESHTNLVIDSTYFETPFEFRNSESTIIKKSTFEDTLITYCKTMYIDSSQFNWYSFFNSKNSVFYKNEFNFSVLILSDTINIESNLISYASNSELFLVKNVNFGLIKNNEFIGLFETDSLKNVNFIGNDFKNNIELEHSEKLFINNNYFDTIVSIKWSTNLNLIKNSFNERCLINWSEFDTIYGNEFQLLSCDHCDFLYLANNSINGSCFIYWPDTSIIEFNNFSINAYCRFNWNNNVIIRYNNFNSDCEFGNFDTSFIYNNNYFPFTHIDDIYGFNIDPMYTSGNVLLSQNSQLDGLSDFQTAPFYDIDSALRTYPYTIGANELIYNNISETTLKNKITIYPNPTSDFVYFESKNEIPSRVEITDVNGKIILNQNISNEIKIDISELNPGNYFIKFYNDRAIIYVDTFIKL